MADLMPEEKGWLIEYCLKPENTRIALRIGQIQVDLERAIISSFFKELGRSIAVELKRCNLDSHWKPGEIWEEKEDVCFQMTMEDRIEVRLYYQGRHKDLYVAVPVESEACPKADRVKPHFEKGGLRLQPSDERWFLWWFYPTETHRWLKDLAPLCDEQAKREKIDYFTSILVHSADAISQELRRDGPL